MIGDYAGNRANAMAGTGAPRPTEIRLKKAEKLLEVDFDDGKCFSLPAELLRVESPSAEVQSHSVDGTTISPPSRPRD